MVELGAFLGRLLGPLLKTSLPLMKNVLKPLAKSVLITLGLTASASATYAVIQKNIFGSGIMKIIKSLEESGLLIKGVSETIQNESKEQKGGFLSMLLGTLGASLLGNLLTGKGVKAKTPRRGLIRTGDGTVRASEGTIRAGKNFYGIISSFN